MDDDVEFSSNEEKYDVFRYISCLPEGRELEDKSPFSLYLHQLNALDETKTNIPILTKRKFNQSLPKKRIASFFVSEDESLEIDSYSNSIKIN